MINKVINVEGMVVIIVEIWSALAKLNGVTWK